MNRREFVIGSAALMALPTWRPRARRAPLHVNGARLNAAIAAFDRVGRTAGGINRVAYSDADLAGRAFTVDLMAQAGLVPKVDAAGNIIARVSGRDAALPPIVIGSHIDSVTDGGNYDGVVGSFGAIEVARTLVERHVTLRHPLEVAVWQNEEGGTVGSKIISGEFTAAELDLVSRSGKTFREGITRIGGDVSRLDGVARTRGSVACYLELHIEQSGLLEQANLQIGVVQGIVGFRWTEVTIAGMANHAGATPMDQRHDALLAAAKFTVAINDTVRGEPGRQVATVGRLDVTPNTSNVIAERVVLSIDLRDLDAAKIARLHDRFESIGNEIGSATGTRFTFRQLSNIAPAIADTGMQDLVDRTTTALGLSRQRMPSGAVHDAQHLARIAPMGMIFVPSIGGISHSPKEFSKPGDITNGADVLLNAVLAADSA